MQSAPQVSALRPAPETTIREFVTDLLGGAEVIEGREWRITNFNQPEKFREILASPHHLQSYSNQSDQFISEPFVIDAEGQIRFEYLLMPAVATFTSDGTGEEGLDLSETDHVRLSFQAQLTIEELELPVVRRVRSELSFEELDQLERQARENDQEEEKNEELHRTHFLYRTLPKLFTCSQLVADETQKMEMLEELQAIHQAIVAEDE